MESLFLFETDACNKVKSKHIIKKLHHLFLVFKCFPFQSAFSQNPRSKELIHHTNIMLHKPTKINCQCSSLICSQ